MKYYYAIIASLIVFCLAGNNCPDDVGMELHMSKPLWNDRKIELTVLDSLGTDDMQQEEYVFGHISDMQLDKEDHLYVLDKSMLRI